MNDHSQPHDPGDVGTPPPQTPPAGDPPPKGPPAEFPRESPPNEVPAKPEGDLPKPEPERAGHVNRQMTAPRSAHLAPAAFASMGVISLFGLSGCTVIEGIFKAGFGVGVLVVITIVAVIGGVVALISRK